MCFFHTFSPSSYDVIEIYIDAFYGLRILVGLSIAMRILVVLSIASCVYAV